MDNGQATSEAGKKMSFFQLVASLPANFWYANLMEILERLAYFGVRAIIPLYLVASPAENGLHLSYEEKGTILGIWALLQCLIPMVSGGYTDRYGYRRSLAVAFVINIAGYLCMAQSLPITLWLETHGWHGMGFWVFLLASCLIATGTAIFKPPCQGTIARCTNEETSSMGWGLFYWAVNIGGALAPMAAASLRGEISWNHVFYAAAFVTAANFLPAFLLYKEPEKIPPKEGDEQKGPVGVFIRSIATVFEDPRFLAFLLISSCFWLMFMQLFDLLPNFVDEWVNTSDVAPVFAWLSHGAWVLPSGQVKPEMIVNIDAVAIVLLVIPISWLVGKVHKITAMVIGMTIAAVGSIGVGATTIGWLCCLMVFVFAIGEMACSPTFNAYIGLVAPPDKKALYMGYANIPFAIGWASGAWLGGVLYESLASKFRLAREYMVQAMGMSHDFVFDDNMLPKDRVMETMAKVMQTGDGPGVEHTIKSALHGVDLSALPPDEVPKKVAGVIDHALNIHAGMGVDKATQLLWDLHHPYMVWVYLGAIGLVGTIGMIIFYFVTRRSLATGAAEQAT